MTDRRRAFVRSYVEHGNARIAALEAGFSESSADTYADTLLRNPEVNAYLVEHFNRVLPQGNLAAYRVLRKIAENEALPAAARVTAARTVLEVGGVLGRKTPDSKPIEEMTGEELRGMIDMVERELGNRAKPVNAPIPSQTDTQLADLIE
jgi:phage terminase small subunit